MMVLAKRLRMVFLLVLFNGVPLLQALLQHERYLPFSALNLDTSL